MNKLGAILFLISVFIIIVSPFILIFWGHLDNKKENKKLDEIFKKNDIDADVYENQIWDGYPEGDEYDNR
jgi:hypothetical protein